MQQAQPSEELESGFEQSTQTSDALDSLARYQVEGVGSLVSRLDLLESIVEYFPGGLCAFDGDLNMTVCNERLKELLDYPPELFGDGLPTIEQLFRFKAKRGEYGPGDIEQHVRSRLRLVAQGQPHRYERKLPDGKIIEVRGRPLQAGGFVTTYVDVTEQRQRIIKLEAVVDNFPGGIAVFDHNFDMILYNNTLRSRIPQSDKLFEKGFPSMESYFWHNARNGEYGEGNLTKFVAQRMEAIRAGRIQRHEVMINEETFIDVTILPLKNGGFVETHIDVTGDRKRSHQLEVIIKNFPGGLAMYDSDFKLLLHNEQFKKLWKYPDELFADKSPSLQDLLLYNASRGEFGEENAEQLVEDRMELAREKQPHHFTQTRPDGTTLEIRGIPIEGSGFLATYADVTEKLEQEAKALEMAHYSLQTGLPNRTLFHDRLNIALAQAERGTNMALLHIDIVGFRNINDTAGQKTADKLLRIVGDRFNETRRDTDTFAHLGADEFVAIQIGIDDSSGADILARRILRTVREPIEVDGTIFELDACIGIALAPQNGTFFDEIQTKAASALFNAKQVGSGMTMFFHSCVNRGFL